MKLLLVDLDGTCRETASGEQFISHPLDQRIIPGADKALTHYHAEGWTIVGITNQGGIAAGHKSLENAIAEQEYTLKLLPTIESILFCPDFGGNALYRVTRNKTQDYKRADFPHPNIHRRFLKKMGEGSAQQDNPLLGTDNSKNPPPFFRSHLNGELYPSFRKPGSGMILFAIDCLSSYPARVLMIGDRAEDEAAAAAANVNFLWANAWRMNQL